MEFYAENEACRLFLYHLSSLFFHEGHPDLCVRAKADEKAVTVTLESQGKKATEQQTIDLSRHRDPIRAKNTALGIAFARAARAFTSYCPPYGTLVGVRPVKVPLFYQEHGFSREKVRSLLETDFLVSPEKAALLEFLATQESAFKSKMGKGQVMLYVSIPFCPSRCSYCSFISSSAPEHLSLIPSYLTLLKEELRATAKIFRDHGKKPLAVYFGGGTPGILSPAQLEDLIGQIREEFDLTECREFCVEMGRPDTITREKLEVLAVGGVQRISINPQTVHDKTLLRIGRRHSAKDFFQAMELARTFSFDSVNCDLIAGLPGESPRDFLQSVNDVLALSPENLTIHALCRKKSASRQEIPVYSPQWPKAADQAYGLCINQGLRPYYLYRQKNAAADLENLGFAKNDKIGIYNLAMMEDLCHIFACGAGGISKIVPEDKGERILRIAGPKYPYEYLSRPEEIQIRLQKMAQIGKIV